jgi:hypothetical protein
MAEESWNEGRTLRSWRRRGPTPGSFEDSDRADGRGLGYTRGLTLFLLGVASAFADQADDLYQRVVALQPERIIREAPVPTLAQVRRSLAGETPTDTVRVPGVEAVQGYGLHVYDLPIQQIWMAISDTPHQNGFTAIDRTETLRGTPRKGGRVTFQLLELPVIQDRWWIVETENNGPLFLESNAAVWEMGWVDHTSDPAIVAALDPALRALGVPVGFARGSWLLVDLGGGKTFADYYVWTDPGGHLPVVATNQFAQQQVARAIAGVDAMARKHIPTCTSTFFDPNGDPLPGLVVQR